MSQKLWRISLFIIGILVCWIGYGICRNIVAEANTLPFYAVRFGVEWTIGEIIGIGLRFCLALILFAVGAIMFSSRLQQKVLSW